MMLRVDDGLDHGHGDAHLAAAWTFSSTSSSKPVSPAVTCELGLAGDAVDGLRERGQHALIRRVHADEHGDAEHDAGRGQQRCAARACGSTAS